ncbi:MAG: helix-turn-helix transcriptional regulator [Ruminococcaceae bacterium]|nr:helix-turn-helix transcriptional regulator [Oscillospiraceae bacterium]MBQ3517952.1 helix-turn-helix transcriptional regulator [Clostridia bacterium]
MVTDRKTLGKRIHDARKSKKMSQFELAEKVDISISHLSSIENGRTSFGVEIFMKIVEALDISSDELLLIKTPAVKDMLNTEFEEIISDCSPAEVISILKMAKEMREAIRTAKSE